MVNYAWQGGRGGRPHGGERPRDVCAPAGGGRRAGGGSAGGARGQVAALNGEGGSAGASARRAQPGGRGGEPPAGHLRGGARRPAAAAGVGGCWPSLTSGAASCRGRAQCSPPRPTPSPPSHPRLAARRASGQGAPRSGPSPHGGGRGGGGPRQPAGRLEEGRRAAGVGPREHPVCAGHRRQCCAPAAQTARRASQQRGARAGGGGGAGDRRTRVRGGGTRRAPRPGPERRAQPEARRPRGATIGQTARAPEGLAGAGPRGAAGFVPSPPPPAALAVPRAAGDGGGVCGKPCLRSDVGGPRAG